MSSGQTEWGVPGFTPNIGNPDSGSTDEGSTETSAAATGTTDPSATQAGSASAGQAAEGAESPYDQAVRQLKQGWLETQAQLLDDPRDAVGKADAMIDEVMKHFAAAVSSHRGEIHRRWSEDDKLSTDELRTTMQSYRSLFQHVMGSAAISASEEPKS